MLGEGLRAGLAHLGLAHRTVCYLEREAYAAAVLAARMEEGSLDGAPIWPDLFTFDSAAWRGAVDCIAAGFPCQDLSLAGKRAGLDGARSGLFFNICDIADACGAWCLFLENVSGIASATATVVDEAEGALDERAAARVLGELADRGWNAEWLTLSAYDVGASHGRGRWFCWAWRPVADAQCSDRRAQCVSGAGAIQRHDAGGRKAHSGTRVANQILDNAVSIGRNAGPDTEFHGCPLFAPGPADTRWPAIIAAEPWLTPALSIEGEHDAKAAFQAAEPLFRGAPDGLAPGLDFGHRAQRLKCVGNGVVALQAAAAFVVLCKRSGVFMKHNTLSMREPA